MLSECKVLLKMLGAGEWPLQPKLSLHLVHSPCLPTFAFSKELKYAPKLMLLMPTVD